MCGMQETLDSLFPTSWLDPYGCMPMNKQYSVQIDITQVETDDGIKVTAVKTPPRAGTTSVQDAINMALGMSRPVDDGCRQKDEGSRQAEKDSKPDKKQESENPDDDPEKPEDVDEKQGNKYPFDKKR